MKAAFCERCGSMEIYEVHGVIVCHHCGAKMIISRNGKTTISRSVHRNKKSGKGRKWWIIALVLLIAAGLTLALLLGKGADSTGDKPVIPEEPTATIMVTQEPTEEPTATPTEVPTAEPTATPTEVPTAEPTATPTEVPQAEIASHAFTEYVTTRTVEDENGSYIEYQGSFLFENLSDIPFDPTAVTANFFKGDQLVDTFTIPIGEEEGDIHFGQLVRDNPFAFTFGGADSTCTRYECILHGTDAYGNELSVGCSLDFAPPETYATPEPTEAPRAEIVSHPLTEYVTVTPVEDENGFHFLFEGAFVFKNVSDIPINPESITANYFSGNRLVNTMTIPFGDGEGDLPFVQLTKGHPYTFSFGDGNAACTRYECIFRGTDANGYEIYASASLDFPPPETYATPVPTEAPRANIVAFPETEFVDVQTVEDENGRRLEFNALFNFVNRSDVLFTPESITAKYYDGDKLADTIALTIGIGDYDVQHGPMLKDDIFSFGFGIGYSEHTLCECILRGTDENGNVIEVSCSMPFPPQDSYTLAPRATATPAPRADVSLTPTRENGWIEIVPQGNRETILWQSSFRIQNNGDIPFMLDYITIQFYAGDELSGSGQLNQETYQGVVDFADLEKRGGFLELGFPTDDMNATHVILSISGTDANGNVIEESARMDFLRDEKYERAMAAITAASTSDAVESDAISVTADMDVSYIHMFHDGRPGYDVTFSYANNSDVPFKPETIRIIWYEGDEPAHIHEIYPSYTLYKGRTPHKYPIGTDQLQFTSVKSIMTGTDENGNRLTTSCTVQLAPVDAIPPVQATENPAAAGLPAASPTVTSIHDIAYPETLDSGNDGYVIYFDFTNPSDVPFTPEYIQYVCYIGDQVKARYTKFDFNYKLGRHDSCSTLFCVENMGYTSVEAVIVGVDANGHILEASCTVPLAQ